MLPASTRSRVDYRLNLVAEGMLREPGTGDKQKIPTRNQRPSDESLDSCKRFARIGMGAGAVWAEVSTNGNYTAMPEDNQFYRAKHVQ